MAISADLFTSLTAHARAARQWPDIGCNDQAATLLAQLLGVNLEQRNDPQWERRCLRRSQWFDERCRDFFRRYPHGMCIDLGAGLSTRFHRLSQSDDWPRFRWVDVDLPDVIALKSGVMPGIDNYSLVSADMLHDNWLAASGWTSDMPLIITLEAVTPALKFRDIARLLKVIPQNAEGRAPIEIAVDCSAHRSPFERFFKIKSQGWAEQLTRLGFTITRMDMLPGNGSLGVLAHLS